MVGDGFIFVDRDFPTPEKKLFKSSHWGVVGLECVTTPFCTSNVIKDLNYIKTWLRSHICASDTQIRTASQTYVQVLFQSVLGTRFGSLELKIGSLESEKIIIWSQKSEKIGSLQVHTGYLTVELSLFGES